MEMVQDIQSKGLVIGIDDAIYLKDGCRDSGNDRS